MSRNREFRDIARLSSLPSRVTLPPVRCTPARFGSSNAPILVQAVGCVRFVGVGGFDVGVSRIVQTARDDLVVGIVTEGQRQIVRSADEILIQLIQAVGRIIRVIGRRAICSRDAGTPSQAVIADREQ